MIRTTATALLLLSATLVACDDDPSGPAPFQGEYTLETTGALTESATGQAWFGSDTDDNGQPVFVIFLGNETSRHLLVAGKDGAGRPTPGSYTFTVPDTGTASWNLMHIIADGDELLGMFLASSGVLIITESSDDVVRGTMEFRADGFLGETPDSLYVSATFTAVPAPSAVYAAADRWSR